MSFSSSRILKNISNVRNIDISLGDIQFGRLLSHDREVGSDFLVGSAASFVCLARDTDHAFLDVRRSVFFSNEDLSVRPSFLVPTVQRGHTLERNRPNEFNYDLMRINDSWGRLTKQCGAHR